MKIKPRRSIGLVLAALVAVALAACAAPAAPDHPRHHPGALENFHPPAVPESSMTQGGMAGGATTAAGPGCPMMDGAAGPGCSMRPADREAMCSLQRSLQAAPNDGARKTMLERHMQGMSPAMRQRHMEMMRQHCY